MTPASARIVLVASLDSKAEEAAFLRDRLTADGFAVAVVDFGILGTPGFAPEVDAETLASLGGANLAALRARADRGAAIDVMMKGAARYISDAHRSGEVAGVISIGGSGGAAVGTAAMRALPFGLPKMMVSTIASGDTRPYVGIKDIVMVNSVVDFAGINAISEPVLRNAAGAMAGMVRSAAAWRRDGPIAKGGPLIAATMFGVTTPAIEHARLALAESGARLIPFHATGMGGQTMESLIADGFFDAVLDLTTTEWADEVVGGSLSAGPARLEAAAKAGIPQVIAPGALDMVNFVGAGGLPRRFEGRLVHRHDDNVVLMRTSPAENAEIGRRIAEKLNAAVGEVVVMFPLRGVSALDRTGGAFFDPDADRALLDALAENLAPRVRLERLDAHVNDKAFADACVSRLLSLMDTQKKDTEYA